MKNAKNMEIKSKICLSILSLDKRGLISLIWLHQELLHKINMHFLEELSKYYHN